jgi:hypothetical protein
LKTAVLSYITYQLRIDSRYDTRIKKEEKRKKTGKMNKALRLCYRTTTQSSALRCQSASPSTKCLAASICPARNLASSSTPPAKRKIQTRTPTTTQLGRAYSTREGTIGKGEEGVVDEVAREREILEAPGHLNEKEREIWSLLHSSLDATSLEVRSPYPSVGFFFSVL